jgi:hypothetical protein
MQRRKAATDTEHTRTLTMVAALPGPAVSTSKSSSRQSVVRCLYLPAGRSKQHSTVELSHPVPVAQFQTLKSVCLTGYGEWITYQWRPPVVDPDIPLTA